MSRIGKRIIVIPENVKVTIQSGMVQVQGPKGEKQLALHPDIEVIEENKALKVQPKKAVKGNGYASIWGTIRALLASKIEGVSQGFERVLELHGIGFRVSKKGQTLEMTLGFSHPVKYDLPEQVECRVEKDTVIKLSGNDKELVGQTAARIRALRPPDVYQNKGIRFRGERLRKKAGKSGGAKG